MNVQLKYVKSFHRKEIKRVLFFCRWGKKEPMKVLGRSRTQF